MFRGIVSTIMLALACASGLVPDAHAELNIIHYERAYELIYSRLYHLREVPFKDIVFAIENAYMGDSLDYGEYNEAIGYMVSALRHQADTYAGIEPNKNMAMLRAVSSCYMEPNEANHGRPFGYDMLPTLHKGYPHYGLVTSLLKTGRGTCRSLPFLFKILADELGAEAYLALAPNHTFIRHQDANYQWWNFETTIGRYLPDIAIAELTEMRPMGISSGLYMTPLRGNQLMILCLSDLLYAYIHRTGRYSDSFIRRCYGVGLLFFPNNPLLMVHMYNDRRNVLCERARRAGLRDSVELRTNPDFSEENRQVEDIKKRIEQMGYQEWSDDYLSSYMQRMQNYVNQHPDEFQ